MAEHDQPNPVSAEDEADRAVYEHLDRWRELWTSGDSGPVATHRPGIQGWLVRAVKWIAQPFVRVYIRLLRGPQRTFNVTVVNHLEDLHRDLRRTLKDLRQVRDDLHKDVKTHARRLDHLESYQRDGLDDLMHYSDALFARLDQKVDRYQREVSQIAGAPNLEGEEGAVAGGESPSVPERIE